MCHCMEVASRALLSSGRAQSLVAKGVGFGALHVLAGPDHLSALATLSVGSSYRAFSVGIRWGVGHSSGLVLVAAVFILMKGDLDLRRIGHFGDMIVGIFMLGIGSYSTYSALKAYSRRMEKYYKDGSEVRGSTSPSNASTHDHTFLLDPVNGKCAPLCGSSEQNDTSGQRLLAFLIGIVHGIAGPGAILGVLPAIEMQGLESSALYLLSFVVTSTLSMGIFAAVYGEVSKRIGSTAEGVELCVSLFSASLSIVVGIVWIVLSSLGRLDRVFH